MSKVTIAPIVTGYRALNQTNANEAIIASAFDNTLSRDGTAPNQMEAPLDMNGFPVLNMGGTSGPVATIINAGLTMTVGGVYVATVHGLALTLPLASTGVVGAAIKIKDATGSISGSPLTVALSGSDTFYAGLGASLTTNYGSWTFIVNATLNGWLVCIG